ncbi:tetratricopeptide repeat protein [Nisaea sediminum]|uniref:tetratricopeptide repeat protein n=1 Tax=Nisaea sediminum TaxID=2775867 RepID=UPI001867AB03|nr:hypothetical protein [Nisaea sediminum]
MRAVRAYRANDLAAAARLLQDVLAADPNNIDAHELTGIVLLAGGNHASAFQILKAVAGAKPADELAQFRLAEAAENVGQADVADRALRRAALAHPQSGGAQLRILKFLAARGAATNALVHARRNVILGDFSSQAFSIRAKIQFGQSDVGSARSDLKRSLVVSPELSGDMLPLAQLYQNANDVNGAEKLYRRFSKILQPRDPQGWIAYQDLLWSRRRGGEATPMLKRALILAPAEPILWQRMVDAEWKHEDPSFAATAAAMCGRENPRAWMLVIQLLAGHRRGREFAARAVEALRRVRLGAGRSPQMRFFLAEMAFAMGDLGATEVELLRFFREVRDGLERRDPSMEHDIGCLLFLYFLLFQGEIEDCARFADLLDPALGGDPDSQFNFRKLKLLLGLLTAYKEQPHSWSSSKRRIISLPVWGAKYVDMWLKYSLPSLFGARNRKLWETGETVFHFFTTPEDWKRLQADPVFRSFCGRHRTVFLNVSPILQSGLQASSYQALSLSHWASMFLARDEGADFIGLVADYIFSDGSMAYLLERAETAGLKAAFTVDLWVAGEAAEPVFDGMIAADGSLSISPEEMVRVFAGNSSARIYFNAAGPTLDSIPSDPSRLFTRLPNGLRIDNLQPQLFFATADVLKGFWFPRLPMTDNGLVDFVLMSTGSLDDSEVLVDPQRFGCIVLDYNEEERAKTGHYPARLKSRNSVRDLAEQIVRSRLWSPGRQWALRNPLYVSFDGEPPQTQDADRFMEAVLSYLPEPRSFDQVDMVAKVGRDAFRRFLAEWKSTD